jgi:hypothetical protein
MHPCHSSVEFQVVITRLDSKKFCSFFCLALTTIYSLYSDSHLGKVEPSPQTPLHPPYPPLKGGERGFEKYLINLGIAITGIAVFWPASIANPEHNADNDSIWMGALRPD